MHHMQHQVVLDRLDHHTLTPWPLLSCNAAVARD